MPYGQQDGVVGAAKMLERSGFMDLILPLLLFFAVFFAILQKVELFKTKEGKTDRKLNTVIALALGLSIVVPHAAGVLPAQYDPVLVLQGILPSSGIVIIVALFAVMLLGFAGGGQVPNYLTGLVGIGSVLALLVIAVYAIWPRTPQLAFLNNPVMQSALIIIAVMGLVIWFVTSGDEKYDAGKSLRAWYDPWNKE
ncbi:MAG: hypothetical protein QGG83_04980 [Candidatus Woesearchaeota archaeon]|jgi:hypothetical protein|nr:hypothetical protein [Candidatus Woesearchaeota archaeon]MDP7180942.1 hypothetical protein [Candidatus Woesearchaeota archaeon]